MRRRTTITIRQDLLRYLDNYIDGEKIRNRSHAVEYILSRAASQGATQAVILASGRGVKMRPFTYEIPKPLIPVHGRPLLEHTIASLRAHGIRDLVITVSHLKEKIQEYFADGSRFGVNIKYVEERSPAGTGASLWQAKEKLYTSPFLLIYGDVLIDVDFTELLQTHQSSGSGLMTLALTNVADPTAYGAVRLRGTKIVEFLEKPKPNSGLSHLVFSGCAAVNQQIFDAFPAGKKTRLASLEDDIIPQLIKRGVLHGYPFEGQWFDVSTPEIYEKVLKEWRE